SRAPGAGASPMPGPMPRWRGRVKSPLVRWASGPTATGGAAPGQSRLPPPQWSAPVPPTAATPGQYLSATHLGATAPTAHFAHDTTSMADAHAYRLRSGIVLPPPIEFTFSLSPLLLFFGQEELQGMGARPPKH